LNIEIAKNQNKPTNQQANQQANQQTATTMSDTSVANGTECTGVFSQEIYVAYAFRYNEHEDLTHRIGISGDYHLFAKHGDKVYMEVKNVGEIVMSFAELQKNKYWKYYYDLSLMLANDKEIKNEAFNNFYDEAYKYTGNDDEYYTENRVWSLDTAYIDIDIDENFKHTYKIIPSGNVCCYKINPADVEKMEYASPQDIDIFNEIYEYRNFVRFGYFINRSEIYKNIAIEYQVSKMEKELEELSTFFEDMKRIENMNIANITAIQEKVEMNIDVLMLIYKNLADNDNADNPKIVAKIERAMEAKNALKLISRILAT
jgi:hypothetical protein